MKSQHPLKARLPLLVFVAVLLLTVAIRLPYLSSYAVKQDDATLVMHSAPHFNPNPVSWIQEGFIGYFDNYPETPNPGARYLRPAVNLSFYLEGLATRSLNSVFYMFTNYAGHALCAAVVCWLGLQLFGLTAIESVMASLLFSTSLAATELLNMPAFRADMLAALFTLLSLLSIARYSARGHLTSLLLASLCATAAAFSKETGVVAPVVCIVWLAFASSGASLAERLRRAMQPRVLVAVVGLPLALFSLCRLLSFAGDAAPGAFGLLEGTLRGRLISVAAAALGGTFFPANALLIARGALLHELSLPEWRHAAAVLLNVCLLVWIAWRARRVVLPDRTLTTLLLLGCLCLIVPTLAGAETRFFYLPQVFLLIALFLLVRQLPGRSGRILLAFACALNVGWFLWTAVSEQPGWIRRNSLARDLQDTVRRLASDPATTRIYLVNDPVGDYGARSLLGISAWDARRPELQLRVVNNTMGCDLARGPLVPDVRFDWVGADLRFEINSVGSCRPEFYGAADADRLGDPGRIAYSVEHVRVPRPWGFSTRIGRVTVTIPEASRGDTAVILFVPNHPSLRVITAARAAPVALRLSGS